MNTALYSTIAIAEPTGWSEDINLTLDDDKDSQKPSIGIFKDNIHVVWTDQRHYPITNRPEIYYRNSTDGGKAWNPEVRLTFSDSTKQYLRMAINQDNIHLVWMDDREGGGNKIYYKNSADGGSTWSADKRISQSFGEEADITVNGSNIHVVYYYDWQIYYINSTNNGITWSEPQILTGAIRDSFAPAIAVNGSNVHIVWTDHYDRFGNPTMGAIFYINSSDGGITWSEDFNLSPMNLDADYPDIAVYGHNIHVTYGEERSGPWQVFYRRSEDDGLTWNEEFMISNSSDGISPSKVKSKQNAIFISWSDLKNPECEVYLRNSSDNGQNWDNEIRLTYDPAWSYGPDIGIGEKSLHLVWHDKRDGAKEIYYKRYPFYPPPSNLTINIQGTDLILYWNPPQNSPSPVNHYNIYRCSTWDGFDFSVPWVNTSIDPDPVDGLTIPLRTTWNNTFAYSDDNNYFYIVRAMNNEGWNDTNTNIVGKYVMPLEKGWNLISLPLEQKDTNISEVLRSIDGDSNIVQWYDAKESIWRFSTSDLTDINRTMGFWIHMINASKLKIVGSLLDSTDIALYEGWNLVGYPCLKQRELNDALSGINWKAVQCYDTFDAIDPWKHNNPDKPENMNDLNEMQPGRGYWIYVAINDTWTRTRTYEDNKMVIWRVGESEDEIIQDQHIYRPTYENQIGMEEDDDFQIDNIPDVPAIRVKKENIAVSFIPQIILIAFVLTEIGLLHRKRR
jgi:hypothetical protein